MAPLQTDEHPIALANRMRGVHVPLEGDQPFREATPQVPDTPQITACLERLGIEGRVTRTHEFIARRPVIRVDLDNGRSVVVKWYGDTAFDSDNEAVMLRLLWSLPLTEELAGSIPRRAGTDANVPWLAFHMRDHATSWSQRAKDGTNSPSAMRHLGTVIAELHNLPVEDLIDTNPDRILHFPIPSFERITPEELAAGYGADFGDYAVTMQALEPQLETMRDGWTTDRLVHGDLRDDNVLLADGRCELIDWELAGFADTRFDLALCLAQPILHELRAEHANLDRAAEWSRHILAGYASVRVLSAADLEATTRYIGVHLLLGCVGRLEKVGALGRRGHLQLLIGSRIVRDASVGINWLFSDRLAHE